MSLGAELFDPVDELIMGLATMSSDPLGAYMAIRDTWTIDDVVMGLIIQKRKQWMDEAHTLLLDERHEESTRK